MVRLAACIALLLLPLTAAASAADLSGLWRGSRPTLSYLQITHKKGGGYQGQIFYPGDAGGNPENGNTIPVITLSKDAVGFRFDKREGSFQGTVSADGKILAGTWQAAGPAAPETFTRVAPDTVIDPSPHTTHMVTVDKGVVLEVLDWGGSGPPLVFLTGLGDTAHVFDAFAPRFTAHHHVYAITRRGLGISSIPAPNPENYDADRLGDDVVAVLDRLKLDRPILAGHSMSGGELSSIGVRHPGRVAALIYLEAGYSYALYAPGGHTPFGVNLTLESKDVEARLEHLKSVARDPRALPAAIADVEKSLPELETDLKAMSQGLGAGDAVVATPMENTLRGKVMSAILDGVRRYDHIDGPILAIYALPPGEPPNMPAALKPVLKRWGDYGATQADAFAAANPQAHLVRIPNGQHYIFNSNPDQVAQDMNAFMDGLH